MIKKQIKVVNELGIHARPAGLIVNAASSFPCEVWLENEEGMNVNAKSIMGVLSLQVPEGDTINIVANGKDEKEAIAALEKLASTGSIPSEIL